MKTELAIINNNVMQMCPMYLVSKRSKCEVIIIKKCTVQCTAVSIRKV